MRLLTVAALLLLALAVVPIGCGPDIHDGDFVCGAQTPRCPPGFTCAASGRCLRGGEGASTGGNGGHCQQGGTQCNNNGTCEDGECCDSCPQDGCCCGNGKCEPTFGETCAAAHCPEDCQAFCGKPTTCGDGQCSAGEQCLSCPEECGACTSSCGNGICEQGEDCRSCPVDCPPC